MNYQDLKQNIKISNILEQTAGIPRAAQADIDMSRLNEISENMPVNEAIQTEFKVFEEVHSIYKHSKEEILEATKPLNPTVLQEMAGLLLPESYHYFEALAINKLKFRSEFGSFNEMMMNRLRKTLQQLKKHNFCCETDIDSITNNNFILFNDGRITSEIKIFIRQLEANGKSELVYKLHDSFFENHLYECWIFGIQATIFNYDSMELLNNRRKDFYSVVSDHVSDIYIWAMRYMFMTIALSVQPDTTEKAKYDKLLQTSDKTATAFRQQIASLNSEIKELKLKRDADKAKSKEEINSLSRELNHKDNIIAKLEETLQAEREANMQVMLASLSSDDDEEDEDDELEEELGSDIPVKRNLPDKGILFLGGHQKLVHKVQELYPDWMYISTQEFNKVHNLAEKGIKISLIAAVTRHISHSLYQSSIQLLPDVPVCYISATNVNRLLGEISSYYERNITS